jgi:hypothetical protein
MDSQWAMHLLGLVKGGWVGVGVLLQATADYGKLISRPDIEEVVT